MIDARHFAKILVTQGLTCGQSRQDFEAEITKRAERRQGESAAQAFTRYITEDETGKLLFKASKLAPPRQAPQDFANPEPPSRGLAQDQLDRLVDEFLVNYNRANSKKLTRAQAYDRVFNSAQHRELRERVKAEERDATRRVAEQRKPIFTAQRQFERKF
jgi:hypothetical protein